MLRRSAFLLAWAAGCASSPSSEEVVRILEPGMSIRDIEQALTPILVDRGRTNAWGSGRQTFFYHLKGDRELVVDTGAYPNHEKAEFIAPLRPKRRWFGIFFDPTPEDRQRAFAIAVDRVREALRAGSASGAQFPIDPGGRLVSENSFRVDLELEPGTSENVEVSCGLASWRTHRVLSLDFLKAGTWFLQVTVDLDEGKVVPTQWTPNAEETARARRLSDLACRDFLSKEGKLEVHVSGEYDYGPLRRLVSVSYQLHHKGGPTSLSGALVDIDAGRLFDWPN